MEGADNRQNHFTGFLIAFLGAVLFSTKAIIVKKAFAEVHVDALSLLAMRMLFSLPFYLAGAWIVYRRKGNIKMSRKEWVITIGLGLFGYYLSSLFDFLGLQYISAGLERLILFLYPSFAVLINALVFRQHIPLHQKLALLLSYAGIGIAYVGEMHIDTSNAHFYLGSLLIFLCSITYSVYIVGSGRMVNRVGAGKFTSYALLSSTAGVLVHFAVRGDYTAFHQTGGLWWYGLLLAVVATVIPTFLLSLSIKKIGSNKVAIISSIGPVSTILQAHYFLGEKIFVAQVTGTVLVLAGVLLLALKRDK